VFLFYLAKEKPYATMAIAETTIQPGETKRVDANFDTALLENAKVFAGVQAQVLESDPAVVKKRDPLTATTCWATVQLELS
jgi:L-2-hydroxyglutarate oxidase LhgO